jgi:hypothetical protein
MNLYRQKHSKSSQSWVLILMQWHLRALPGTRLLICIFKLLLQLFFYRHLYFVITLDSHSIDCPPRGQSQKNETLHLSDSDSIMCEYCNIIGESAHVEAGQYIFPAVGSRLHVQCFIAAHTGSCQPLIPPWNWPVRVTELGLYVPNDKRIKNLYTATSCRLRNAPELAYKLTTPAPAMFQGAASSGRSFCFDPYD